MGYVKSYHREGPNVLLIFLGAFALFIFSAFALESILDISGHNFRDGTIISKEFEAAHPITVWDPLLEIPVTEMAPDRYYFTIEKYVRESEELYQRTIQVGKEAYDSFEVEQYYDWERD